VKEKFKIKMTNHKNHKNLKISRLQKTSMNWMRKGIKIR